VSNISYSTKKYLGLLLVAIFAVSFVFSLYYQIRPTVDAKAYNNIAWNLARGYGYVEHERNAATPATDDAIVRVGPGYEFFLAGVYSALGHHIWIVWLLQALLRVGTAYVLFRIVLLLFNNNSGRESIALLAGAIFGFIPDLIILNGMLLAETLFITSLVFALYASFRALDKSTASLSASLWWGVSALVRPTALIFTLFYSAYAYITKRRAGIVVVALLFPVLLLGAWSLRNSLLYRTPLFTTTAGAYALWVGNNPDATGGFDKTLEIQAIRDQNHSVELSKIGMRKYFEFLREEPVQFVMLQIRKTSMYFSVLRPSGFWFYVSERPVDRLLTLLLSSVATGFLFIMGGAGMYVYARRREKYHWFLISVALLQPLTVIPTYVETRYRAPFFPFLALFAAYLIYLLWQQHKEHAPLLFRALFFSSILIMLLTLGDSLYSYDIIVERLQILFTQLSQT
jgi:4-amino-4-deoxy-L-arabinose transferase-like glycosyltransferase